MRYVTEFISRDLKKKLVFLAGPRQVGKSTVAKKLIQSPSCYLNWDISADRKTIRDIAWPKDQGLVVLDEIHKFIKWKGFLKGIIDQYSNVPPLLVTGSARLETFRKGGDALTGRTYLYRLHPIDPLEACAYFGAKSPLDASIILLKTGGFPEAYLNQDDAARLREDRLQLVVREDIRDLSVITELRGMQLLIELLRERVGGPINYSNLASDIGVSPPTIKKWITLLERLYVIFLVYPFSRNLARSIRREPKAYFYDCAAATSGDGFCFENLIGGSLLKYIHFQNDTCGTRYGLHYYRDKDGREVDFVITNGLKPILLVEAKLNEVNVHPGLVYLSNKIADVPGFQVLCSDLKTKQIGVNSIISVNAFGKIISGLK